MRRYELDNYFAQVDKEDTILHYGVLGQKWGVRNYQNKDGSLTEKGRTHYATKTKNAEGRGQKWGSRLKNSTAYRNAITAHKLYSATKGITPSTLDWNLPRRQVGTMRKAAFVKGMYEGASGKKMAATKYRELQDNLSREHRANVKRDLAGLALVGATAVGSGMYTTGVFTANPALAAAGYGLTVGGGVTYGANEIAQTVGRGIRAGMRTYDIHKDIESSQGRSKRKRKR